MSAVERYPEHVKLQAVAPHSQKIAEFIDWIDGKGYRLVFDADEAGLSRAALTDCLAEFFEIDLEKIETEKRAMLEELRGL